MSEEDKPFEEEGLVVRGDDGDPLPEGTRMFEGDSYERLIDGLKIAADAASHLIHTESEHGDYWRKWRQNLDGIRKIAVSYAGREIAVNVHETKDIEGGKLMPWKEGRERFREGLKQASGGARQLATCHRLDMTWSTLSTQLELISTKAMGMIQQKARQARRNGLLWVPDSYQQH